MQLESECYCGRKKTLPSLALERENEQNCPLSLILDRASYVTLPLFYILGGGLHQWKITLWIKVAVITTIACQKPGKALQS